MAVLIEGVTVVPTEIFYAIVGMAILSSMMFMFLVTFIKGKIPETVSLMKAEFKKTPWVHIHTSLSQLEFAAPKRSGDDNDENMYDMEKWVGVKLVPDPEKVEHTVNGRRIIHYYSKAAPPITAKESAACRDVLTHLSDRGIPMTESLVDALFIATDAELEDWYADDEVMLRTIVVLKEELKNKFIQDGQFVWDTVNKFIFSAANDTARALDEFKSIAHEQADDINRRSGTPTDMAKMVVLAVVFMVGLAITYNICVA